MTNLIVLVNFQKIIGEETNSCQGFKRS